MIQYIHQIYIYIYIIQQKRQYKITNKQNSSVVIIIIVKMDILYKGCPNANNLTHCEPVSCNKFNEVLYSDKLVVTVQGTFAFIFFLIFIFCIAQTISDIKRSNIKSRRELKLFYSKTPTIILSLEGSIGISYQMFSIYTIEILLKITI